MKFEDIPGYQSIKERLALEVKHNRTPHAQIFAGNSGSGALTLAIAFAQFLMCENKLDRDSCGTCASCQKVNKYIHPDLHLSFPVIKFKPNVVPTSADFIEPFRKSLLANPYMSYIDWMKTIDAENKQGNITRDECRSIINRLSLKTFENQYKVLIMWLPEYLGGAGNVLLKLLEEPSPNTRFILVSNSIDKILPTILSRCQLVKIPPFAHEDISKYLIENKGTESQKAEEIAFLASGDLNRAMLLTEDDSGDDTEWFEKWMKVCKTKELGPIMQFADDLAFRGKEKVKSFLSNTISILRECNSWKYIPDYKMKTAPVESNFRYKFSEFLSYECTAELYSAINNSIYNIERNANLKIELFQLSLTLRDALNRQNRRRKAALSQDI